MTYYKITARSLHGTVEIGPFKSFRDAEKALEKGWSKNLIQPLSKNEATAYRIKNRLEELRTELRAERISYSELIELQDLASHIEPHDVELLEAAGVPEKH